MVMPLFWLTLKVLLMVSSVMILDHFLLHHYGKIIDMVYSISDSKLIDDKDITMSTPKLSPISYLVSVLIGLGTFDAIAAQTGDPERKTSIFNSQPHYLSQVTMGAFYGEKANSYGSLDVLVPVVQRADSLLFVDVRGMMREHPVQEYNLGVGYRWLNDDVTQLYGVYGFFDRKRSNQKEWYSQLTLGGEWKVEDWSFGGNVYIPVGKSKNVIKSAHSSGAEVYQGDKFIIGYLNKNETEYAMHGFDVEAGYTLPALPALTARLGGFYFNHKDTKAIVGPRAGLSYDFAPMLGKSFNWINSLSVETSYQYDNSRHGIFYAGLQLTVPLGSQAKRPEGLRQAMTEFVRRDLDIVVDTNTVFEAGKALNSDGSVMVGKIVSTNAELDAAAADPTIDIIGVKGQIDVAGNTFVDENTAAAVTLQKGQSITGGGFTYTADGVTHTTAIVNSANGITGANPNATSNGGLTLTGTNGNIGHLLSVYSENTASVTGNTQRIQDLVLRVPEGGATGQYSAAITNMTGKVSDINNNRYSFGNVVIDNVNSNGSFEFGTAVNRTGQMTIQNSTINVVNPVDTIGAIDLVSVGQNDLTIKSINNNTISATSDATEVTGLHVSWLNGAVKNNTFTNISTTAEEDASGIVVANDLTGDVSGNVFTNIASTGADAHGIFIEKSLDGTIDNNVFTSISAGGAASGVSVNISSDRYSDMNGIVKNNTFTAIAGSSAYGIVLPLGEFSGSVDNNASIVNNTFTHIASTSGNAYGLYLQYIDGGSVISGNSFANISSTQGSAYGLYTQAVEYGAVISDNVFTSISSGQSDASGGLNAYGLYINNYLRGVVTNNTFRSIASFGQDAEAYGLFVNGTVENNNTTITGNAFNSVEAYAGKAYGIRMNGGLAGTSLVNNNTINVYSPADDGYGLYIVGSISGSYIQNNRFNLVNMLGGNSTAIYLGTDLSYEEVQGITGNHITIDGVGVRTGMSVVSDDGQFPTERNLLLSNNSFSGLSSPDRRVINRAD